MLEINKDNIKETWRILNTITGRGKKKSYFPNSFESNNKVIDDPMEIASEFNTFFVNIGPDLAKKIKQPENVSIYQNMPQMNENTMFLSDISEKELIRVVNNFKRKSSTDCHNINMSIIKDTVKQISKPLSHICNKSFENRTFPDKMKIAKVVPIFKAGERNSFTNYRPVSLLPQFSKILEKLFHSRLENFLDKNTILNENQYGFRTKRSTALALMQLTEELTTAIDNRKISIGVFVDLKKAFDTIDHDILINKLEHYGIRGVANEWLKSYLCNRRQYVKFNNCESNLLNVRCGVPQGSVLGPTLFLLYINDICNVSQILKSILFADDTNFFCSGYNINELCQTVCDELVKLDKWFALNKLSRNIEKTNFMIFSHKYINNVIDINITNRTISRVHTTKFLGVIIDEKLNWKEHINYIKTKLSKSISIMYKAREMLNKNSVRTLYCTLFLPFIDYCAEVWGNTYNTNLRPLIILQKRAIRIIEKVNRRSHTSTLFYSLKIMKLEDMIELKTLVVMYKAKNNCLPVNIQNIFEIRKEPRYRTRQTGHFVVKYFRTNIKSHCISIKGVKLWNSLDINLVRCKTEYAFKREYKKSIFNKYV